MLTLDRSCRCHCPAGIAFIGSSELLLWNFNSPRHPPTLTGQGKPSQYRPPNLFTPVFNQTMVGELRLADTTGNAWPSCAADRSYRGSHFLDCCCYWQRASCEYTITSGTGRRPPLRSTSVCTLAFNAADLTGLPSSAGHRCPLFGTACPNSTLFSP